MLRAKNLYVEYGENDNVFSALNDICISFEEGKFTSIVGRSGSGKSTLLNVLSGLQKPKSGEVWVQNQNLYKYTPNQLSDYRGKHIGFIFQSFHLENLYTVYENIEIALMIGGYPRKKRKKRIDELLSLVNMQEKIYIQVGKLSGGEKQRVCIARAIANCPDILFADEPCGNLDSHNSEIIMELLGELAKKGTTVILVTHNNDDAKKTDRVIELQDGKVIKDEKIR